MMIIDGQSDLIGLGILIRQRRLELQWKQSELAERAQVSQGALSTFEQAGTGMRLDRLISVLRALGLQLSVESRVTYQQEVAS